MFIGKFLFILEPQLTILQVVRWVAYLYLKFNFDMISILV